MPKKMFPKIEGFGLTSQMRGAAVSIPFDSTYESPSGLARRELDAGNAMRRGGDSPDIVPEIATYFITREVVITLHARRVQMHFSGDLS